MWLLVSNSKEDEKYPVLGDKKYVVGRIGCDIIINDPSVSRRQAILMMAHYEANVVKSFITPSLSLEDSSKFGTFVNGESVKKKPGSMVTLKDGDKIQFGGSPASLFVARYEPFVATTSCLEKGPKKNLQRVMCLLGGHIVREWRTSCDLLIMAKINVTIKVICAINNQKPIVTPDYLDHFHQFLMGERENKPDPKDYLPEVVDKEVPAGVSFHPDVRRSTLLKELKFYFLSALQFNKTNLAVSTAGGLPILLEDGTEEDAEMMTQDGTIVVAVSRDVLSSLNPTCQKFVRTVCLVLKKKNLRMVTDPEIGWAILTCNTDDFCNPKSAITPSMYSSMASQSLSLSQMTEIDNLQYANSSHSKHLELVSGTSPLDRAVARATKRQASQMEKDEVMSTEKTVIEDSVSAQEPAGKKVKPEPSEPPSQKSVVKINLIPQFKPPLKSPQVPSSCVNIDQDVSGKNGTNDLNAGYDCVCTCPDVDNELEEEDLCNAEQSHVHDVDGDEKHQLKNVVEVADNDKVDPSEKLIGASIDGLPSTPSSSPNNRLADSSTKDDKDNHSASGFLNKKCNSNNTTFEDILNSEKDTKSSSSNSSAKGKRKKRAMFCDDSKDDESDLLSSSKRNKVDSSVRNEDVHSSEDHINAGRVGENIADDLPSSSVICNGNTNGKGRNGAIARIVKEESPTPFSPRKFINYGDPVKQKDLSPTGWTTVKKEERDDVAVEEQKHQMDLELDDNGQPLRHLCQVKVVELIARVSTSRPGEKDTPQNQQTNVKNFKKFKKTVHCGTGGLPTIIGGQDLEPHKGTRFNHIEQMLSESGGTQNGVEADNDRDAMFGWQEDEVINKRRTKRK